MSHHEARKAFVHIGFHKTGTTSIQAFLDDHREVLSEAGIAFYEGRHIRGNHVELHLASMRRERQSPFKLGSGIDVDAAYIEDMSARISAFEATATANLLLFSAEGLSYLRFPDEFSRLRTLIKVETVHVIAYLRERDAWLRSYAREVSKYRDANLSDKDAFDYLGHDSWLLDYQARLEPFRREFGSANVHVVDYDQAMLRDQSAIPSFLEILGVRTKFDDWAWRDYWHNRSP